MSLDVLRAIQKSGGSTLKSLLVDMQTKLSTASSESALEPAIRILSLHLKNVSKFIKSSQAESMDYQLKSARDFAFTLAKLYQAVLLVDHAVFTRKSSDIYAANHFSKTRTFELIHDYSLSAATDEYDLVFANYIH